MFGLPLHPAVVHLPLGIAIVLPIVATLALVGIIRNLLPARAWWLVFALQSVMLLSGFLAVSSGENDADAVKEIVVEEAIHDHQTKAKQFMLVNNLAVLLSIGALATAAAKLGRLMLILATIGTFLSAGMSLRVGQAGGELVYVHGAASAHTDEGTPTVDEHGEVPQTEPARD
jgi:uncharacterized membrane protein